MKRTVLSIFLGVLFLTPSLLAQDYIIIGWNDLGMHCSNQDFSTFVVLPPYNNIHAQVIRVGDAVTLPLVVTSYMQVTYEIPGNTYSVGKTNFWDYEDQIFGVNLAPNIGLTGAGLTGDMAAQENYFIVTGVPITPYTDADLVHEDPFQLGMLKLYDQSSQLLATAQPVVPVSNEINCVGSGCHASVAALLSQHDAEGGFDPGDTPILCADCHASNALGMPGIPEVPSLSQVIHEHHGEITNDCYKCHPGPNTQCLRDVMSTQHGFVCQTCHGSVTDVGHSIDQGREPWFDEPACGAVACHGAQYAEEPGKLFRESRGHGNLFCSACHGEPHAIVPSRVERDNLENILLQGYAGTLDKCEVCHGIVPTEPGPHGLMAETYQYLPGDVNMVGGTWPPSATGPDVTFLVNFFRGLPTSQSCLLDGFWCSADANGDCNIIGSDVTYLVNVFRGIGSIDYCPDYPPAWPPTPDIAPPGWPNCE
jgi:hypothetical protein